MFLGFVMGGFTDGLEFGEVFGVFFEIAADAGFVECEQGEVLAVLEPDAGLAGGGVDFGAVAVCGVANGAGQGYGEDVVFERAGAVETPVVLGDGDGEGFFVVGFGFEVCEEGIAVDVKGGFVFTGEGVELSGETVAQGVDAAVLLAVRSFGAGGFLRVLLVGCELRGGDW